VAKIWVVATMVRAREHRVDFMGAADTNVVLRQSLEETGGPRGSSQTITRETSTWRIDRSKKQSVGPSSSLVAATSSLSILDRATSPANV
jgi:hypothetical protein